MHWAQNHFQFVNMDFRYDQKKSQNERRFETRITEETNHTKQ